MRVERCADVEDFLTRAEAFLVAREAEHNLILGLCDRLRHDPHAYGSDPYYAVAEHDDRIVGAALRTPPWAPILSELDAADAAAAFADDLHATYGFLPGVRGPKDAARTFAEVWRARTGVPARVVREERIYRAAAVTPPAGVAGRLRPYAPGDLELATSWLEAFVAEVGHGAPNESARVTLERRLAEPGGGFVFWDAAGETVSLAGFGGPTPNGIRVGPVYTPPEHRRHGYASALTAAVTQQLLDGGRRFCFLFTDLANPTSNSIYQQVGYEPVADVDQWLFE